MGSRFGEVVGISVGSGVTVRVVVGRLVGVDVKVMVGVGVEVSSGTGDTVGVVVWLGRIDWVGVQDAATHEVGVAGYGV